MSHDDEFIGEFWLNLMVAAGRYKEKSKRIWRKS